MQRKRLGNTTDDTFTFFAASARQVSATHLAGSGGAGRGRGWAGRSAQPELVRGRVAGHNETRHSARPRGLGEGGSTSPGDNTSHRNAVATGVTSRGAPPPRYSTAPSKVVSGRCL
ncbi:hypothetical protein E2C01_093355 [Portunus trituberculatus]|uniref:Uncharacterized protein n=1 Tax=Portunus trituberculatus TaxID=210409 RepID=A0A5B7JUK3_PORTR|nr:hypothetical protein [Portunus trituberculatus]